MQGIQDIFLSRSLVTFAKAFFQIRSHSEVRGVRTWTYVLGETPFNPVYSLNFQHIPFCSLNPWTVSSLQSLTEQGKGHSRLLDLQGATLLCDTTGRHNKLCERGASFNFYSFSRCLRSVWHRVGTVADRLLLDILLWLPLGDAGA